VELSQAQYFNGFTRYFGAILVFEKPGLKNQD
jgi:hypothetical protein